MDDLRDQLDRLRLHTQADVHRLWELLMGPLGFASVSVWVVPVDEQGATLRHITKVEDDGDQRLPTTKELHALVDVLAELAREDDEVVGYAVLLSRPGRHGLTDTDRRFAADVLAAFRDTGIRCLPVHVADDQAVMAITPDDLAS